MMKFQSKEVIKNNRLTEIISKYWIIIFIFIFLPISYLIYGHAKLFDDNYIYLQYAKHFIEHGELSFNAGQKSYGFTSPFWQILYIIVYYFIRSEYIAPVLSLTFAVLTILLCYYLLKDYLKRWFLLFPVILIISFDPIFIKHMYNGMETSLVFFLSYIIIAGIILTEKIKSESLTGIIFGSFLLVRPESAILSLFAAIYLVLKGKLKLNGIIKIVSSAAAVCLPWIVFTYFYYGRILPDTFGAKGADYPLGKSFFENIFDIIKIFGGNYIFLIIIFLFSIKKATIFIKKDRAKYFLTILILIIYSLFYAIVISGGNVFSRYLCITSPVIILLFIHFSYDSEKDLKRQIITYYSAAILLLATSVFYSRIDKQLVENSKVIQDSVLHWVLTNTPDESYIGYATIGELGYYSQRRIFDPQGLINREISSYYNSDKIEDYYLLKRPDYLISIPEVTVNKIREHARVELKKEFVFDFRYLLRHIYSSHSTIDTLRIYKVEYR